MSDSESKSPAATPSPGMRLARLGALLIALSIILSMVGVIDGTISTGMLIFGVVIGLVGMARLGRERKAARQR